MERLLVFAATLIAAGIFVTLYLSVTYWLKAQVFTEQNEHDDKESLAEAYCFMFGVFSFAMLFVLPFVGVLAWWEKGLTLATLFVLLAVVISCVFDVPGKRSTA